MLKREEFTEKEYFIIEAALQLGFEIVDDDATVFQVTDEWIIEFAKRIKEATQKEITKPIPEKQNELS